MKIYAARNTMGKLEQMVGKDLWVLADIQADCFGLTDKPYRAWIQIEDIDQNFVCTFLEHKLFTHKTHTRNRAYVKNIHPVGEFFTTAELDEEMARLKSLMDAKRR